MTSKIKLSFATVAVVLLAVSFTRCTKDFVKMNTNPNESAAAAPQSLIGPTLNTIINTNINRNLRINNEFMQVSVTYLDSREFHRYEVRPSESEATWKSWYLALSNIKDMYDKAGEAQQKGYRTYQGISLILETWVYALLTDMYGDIPYYESNKGHSHLNTTPAFEKQQDIYRDLFLKLETANLLLKEGATVEANIAQYDPIFATAPEKWRKFGNTLYLRLLLRVAHKPETNALAKIKEIIESNPAEYPVMNSNEDSAILYFSDQLPYINPYQNARDIDFNGDKGYAEFFINNLLELQDPRLPIWSTEASLGVYGGIQSAYPKGSTPDKQSTLKLTLKGKALMGNIMNYGELQFIMAEMALRGYINQDPELYYKKGVEASMSLWNAALPAAYFNNPKVGFLDSDSTLERLKKVHLQKYFALMFTDFQQWFEYRRTQLLDLYRGPGLMNNGQMPVRLNYPLIVQSLNNKHYKEAVARLGGDGINNKMWWQQGTN